MSLETSYEVLDMLRDDGVQTFRATEKATGRGLELHLFPPFGRPENKTLFEKLKTLPLDTRRKFLDIGVDGSTPYLVTDPLPGARGFKSWAEEWIAGKPEPRSAFDASFAPPSKDDGVQILQAGQWKTGTPIPQSLVTKPAPAAPATPQFGAPNDLTAVFQMPPEGIPDPVPTPKGPSEFTAMFQSLTGATAPLGKEPEPVDGEFTGFFQSEQSAAPPPAPPALSADQPGEFTRMFKAPNLNLSDTPPPPVPPAAGGEFEKYYESPLKPGPMSGRPLIEAPPPPPTPLSSKGGDYTKLFGNPAAPQTPVQGEFFGAMPTATGAFSAQPPVSQPQTPPNFGTGQSEYTRMMANPVAPAFGQPSAFGQTPAAPPIAPVKKRRSSAPIFIALGAVLVLAIGIVIFLLAGSGGAPANPPASTTTPAAK